MNIKRAMTQPQGTYQPMHDDDIKALCHQYMNYHVIGQMSDGSQMEGIITGADENGVSMLVPEDIDADQMNRQYGDYGYYNDNGNDNYGYRRKYRRYRPQRFPYYFLRRLFRYPYYTPYYSWYGYGRGY